MSFESIILNVDEVLAHLKHILGQNIVVTNEQLQNFMHDLRKLIKDDQKRKLKNKENIIDCMCKCHGKTSVTATEEESTSDSSTYNETESVVSESTDANSVKNLPKISGSRPATSFIRPWRTRHTPNTGPPGRGPSKTLKEDPVKLFHHYQDVWKHHRFPGETGHLELRWNIREKMLGIDPNPRDNQISRNNNLKCDCCTDRYPAYMKKCFCCVPGSSIPFFKSLSDRTSAWKITVTFAKMHKHNSS